MAVLNTRQRIAVSIPSDTSESQLYVVPANTEIDGLLRICNQDVVQRTYRIAHCAPGYGDNNVVSRADWIFYDKAISANSTDELSIHAKATEPIRIAVGAGTASRISFHLSGNVKVTS